MSDFTPCLIDLCKVRFLRISVLLFKLDGEEVVCVTSHSDVITIFYSIAVLFLFRFTSRNALFTVKSFGLDALCNFFIRHMS